MKSLRLEENKELTPPKDKQAMVKTKKRLFNRPSPLKHGAKAVLPGPSKTTVSCRGGNGKQRIDSLERQFRHTELSAKKPRITYECHREKEVSNERMKSTERFDAALRVPQQPPLMSALPIQCNETVSPKHDVGKLRPHPSSLVDDF